MASAASSTIRDSLSEIAGGSAARDPPPAGCPPRRRAGIRCARLRSTISPWVTGLQAGRIQSPIHVAEQVREVEASLKITGKRPVELLDGQRRVGPAMVPDPRHASERCRAGRHRPQRRGGGALPDHRVEPRRRHLRWRPLSSRRAGRLSASAAIPTSRSMRAPSCANSNAFTAPARPSPRRSSPGRKPRPAWRLWRRRPAPVGHRLAAETIGRITAGTRADFVTLDTDHPAHRGQVRRRGARQRASSPPMRRLCAMPSSVAGGWSAEGRHVARRFGQARFARRDAPPAGG